MVAHRSGDVDAAGWAFGLKPRSDIHHVAMQVCAIGNRITNVEPDAKPDCPIRGWSPSWAGTLLLHLCGTAHRPVDAIEYD